MGKSHSKMSDPQQHTATHSSCITAPTSPQQRVVTYLRTTCSGWGVWAEGVRGREHEGVGEWVCGKSSSLGGGCEATMHQDIWCMGSLVAMGLMTVAWGVSAFVA